MNDLVIDFDKLAENAKTAPNDLLRVFKKAGAELAGSWVGKMKREQGISYKPITLVFADGIARETNRRYLRRPLEWQTDTNQRAGRPKESDCRNRCRRRG